MSDQHDLPARRTRAPGDRARARIAGQAAELATVEGLDGLSIGRLAEITGVPKSSVHALFGSKEELQLATVNAARESFIREVVGPALAAAEPGRDRLLALCDGYLSYVQRRIFPGGCFFVAASAEVGARAGRVHDEVARVQQQWRDLLVREARAAADKGQLAKDTDPAQLAFELGVILAGTDIVSILHDDTGAIARGRAAVRSRCPARDRPVPPTATRTASEITNCGCTGQSTSAAGVPRCDLACLPPSSSLNAIAAAADAAARAALHTLNIPDGSGATAGRPATAASKRGRAAMVHVGSMTYLIVPGYRENTPSDSGSPARGS